MRETHGRLIIICGLPGAGKSTFAGPLAERPDATLFASDDWLSALELNMWDGGHRHRVEIFQWRMAKAVLRLGGTAIIEWGSWTRAERDVLRLGARELGAAVELIYLTAPVETLFERISRRRRERPPITFDMLKGWAEMFEAPTPEEFGLYDAPPKDHVR